MPYTYTQPVKKPDFAMLDGTNGVAGGVNTAEPPNDSKDYGWDFGEKPTSSWMNWIHRTTANWVYYLDERVTELLTFMADSKDSTKTKTAADADNYFRSQW